MLHDGFHEPQLEVERCLDPHKGKSQQTISDPLGQPWGKTLHDDIELSVVQEILKRLFHLLRLIRSYLVKLT